MKTADPSWEGFKKQIETPDRPRLGPEPRAGRLSLTALNRAIDGFLANTDLPSSSHFTLRSAALLWHDYLDESHALSQGIRSAEGSFLHGIMHRREPDYANAKYWFQRVGQYPCYAPLARAVVHLLESRGEGELIQTLVPGGHWDASGFVDACEAAEGLPAADRRVQTLEAVQEIEFDCFLAYLFEGK